MKKVEMCSESTITVGDKTSSLQAEVSELVELDKIFFLLSLSSIERITVQ